MRVLLDTHAFLWWNMDDDQLSEHAREIIADGNNAVFLSAASAWEIAIKAAKGKLILPESPAQYVTSRLSQHHFLSLPIEVRHALRVYELPRYHDDPFDRLLVAQCQIEQLPMLTTDGEMKKYEIETLW
jgi:PIN domain nuclease of toxin-antitoxin system